MLGADSFHGEKRADPRAKSRTTMTADQNVPRADTETAAGAVLGGGFADTGKETGTASGDGDHQSGQFDAGDFIVDHDVDPPEEEQPTTSS
jgi:hypothetical protein